MLLNRGWIESHVPHAGRMCLLDEVLEWDADRILCRSATHRAADNPLRAEDRLGAACGIEYAAQAMAVHGALVSSVAATGGASLSPAPTVSAGYLASVRGVKLFVARLDDLSADLIATATRVHSDSITSLYEFTLSAADRLLLQGRAAIVFDITKSPRSP